MSAESKATSGGRCPICGKPSVHAVRPFCSSRCADIDLGRWVSGAYVIGSDADAADEDGLPAAGANIHAETGSDGDGGGGD
jgi:uncharacterized protein